MCLPGLLALDPASLPGQLLLGLLSLLRLLADGPLERLGLLAHDRTLTLTWSARARSSPAHSARSRATPDSMLTATVHWTAMLRFMSMARCKKSK